MSKGELPLIALVNSKSGGQDGPKLIKKLLEHISKENVFDLADGGPAVGLATCKNQRTKVLVCGGDGTVAWVLSEIKKLDFDDKLRPVVAILPLGTANDLSRTLKWGPGWAGEKLSPLISQIDKASVVHMDQWHVVSSGNGDNEEKLYVMNNYFSVGSDAEVALKFHKKREKKPTLFKNRTLNKGFYAKYAVGTFLRAQPLSASLDVELDGVKIEIPNNISVLLVLNTPSYASGMNPWGAASKKKKHLTHQTIDDGKFEVVGIKGLLHAGGLQMRMVKGKKLGQGAALTIKTNRPMAAQVDGEPWLQEPAVIKITHGGHALMLANSPPNAKKEKAEVQPAPSATVISLSLEGEPPSPSKQRPVSRTYSSNTISTINYGPVPATKRRKNRYYCDICDFEFFLPYMLDNHKVQGCKGNLASSSSSSSSSSDSVYAQPSSLSHAASAPVTSNNKHESSEDSESETSVVSVLLRITEEAEVEVESQEESFPDKAAIDQTSPDRCLSSPDKLSDSDFVLAEKVTSESSGEASTPASNEPAPVTEDPIPEKEEKEEKKDEEKVVEQKEDEREGDHAAAEEVIAKTEALATTEEAAKPVTEEAPAKEESSTNTEQVATPVKDETPEEVAPVSDEAATPVKEDTPAEVPVTDAATPVKEDTPAEATPVAAETAEVVASSKPEPVEEENKESKAPEDDASSSSSSSSSSDDSSSSSSDDEAENDKEEPTEESKEVDEAVTTGTQEEEPVVKDNIEESPKAQNEDATNSTEQSNVTTSDTPLDEEKHEQKLNGHTNEDSETTTKQIAEENADHSSEPESKSDTTKETKESEQNAEVVESEPKPKKKEVVVWPLFQQRMRA